MTQGPSLSGCCCDRGSFPVALRRSLQSEKGKLLLPCLLRVLLLPGALPVFCLLFCCLVTLSLLTLFFAFVSLYRFESILMTLQKLLLLYYSRKFFYVLPIPCCRQGCHMGLVILCKASLLHLSEDCLPFPLWFELCC